MKEEPDIIKELRKEEHLGKLQSQSGSIYEIQEKQESYDEENKDIPNFFNDDIKKKKVNNITLGNLEERYRIIFENYAVGITLVDDKERIVSWNKYTKELFNMDEKDLHLKHVSNLYPPDEWIKIRKQNIRQKGMKFKFETKMIRKGEKPFDAEISLCVLRGAGGKVTGSIGIIRDITRLKVTERRLIESEEKYRTIFDNSAVAIMLTDENENVISWNKYAENMLNMDEEDLYMKPAKSLYPPEEWDKIRKENVRRKGMQHHLETKILRKNDDALDIDISLSVLKDFNGKIVGSIGVIKDISERKIMETRLSYERNLLQSLLDSIPDSIYFKDKDSRFVKVNRAKAVHSNTSIEEMIRKTDFDFLSAKDAKVIHRDDKKVMETGEPIVNKIEKLTDKNGVERWVSVTKIPRYDERGDIIGTMGISRDITELKKAEDIVRKSEKRYRSLFDTAIDPIVVLDEKGFFVDVNDQVTKSLSYNKEELIGKRFDKAGILSEEFVERTLDYFKRRIAGEDVKPYEIKVVAKNGEMIPAEINASPLYEDKKVVGDLIILKDLRERFNRKIAEKGLIESEKKFREIFNATGDLMLYIDTYGSILDINKTALNLVGLEKEELMGKDLAVLKNLFSSKNMKKHIESIDETVNGGNVREYESELVTKEGIKHRFLFSTDVIKEKEKVTGILFRGRDITQRQRAWDELVKLEEKYRVLAETSADGVITIDSLGRLTYVNPSFENICGRRKSQILATLLRDYLSNDSIYLFQQVFMDIRKKDKKVENIELELVHFNGKIVPIDVNIAPLYKRDTFMGMICTVRDITERKKVEDELKKSERLKTEFMNIAAHELKSPVTPIKGYLELIISDEDANKRIKSWAKISHRNSERLLKLVDDILDVSRLNSDTMRFDMEKLDSVDILSEVVEDMRPCVENKDLEFILDLQRNLPPIMGDRSRLLQTFRNVIGNALKFTDNGSITIRSKKEEDFVLISVEDTGTGVSHNELKKIFTKFYQAYTGSDRNNEGTGLGLFICKEIVEKHNGKIWAESNLKEGSKFFIKLPHL